MVEIGGFQRVSLMDYPGKITSIIFLTGCNMRCPFCHNAELVMRNYNSLRIYGEDEILEKISEALNFIEAVTITGGEPTLHQDLEEFLLRCKNLGLSVKLDTNGLNPEKTKRIIEKNLVDYIAMDVKSALNPARYSASTGLKHQSLTRNISESIKLIINSGIRHEFRTTVVPGLVSPDDLLEIAASIKGADAYYLQQYNPGKTLDPKLAEVKPYSRNVLDKACARILQSGLVTHCEVRATW